MIFTDLLYWQGYSENRQYFSVGGKCDRYKLYSKLLLNKKYFKHLAYFKSLNLGKFYVDIYIFL